MNGNKFVVSELEAQLLRNDQLNNNKTCPDISENEEFKDEVKRNCQISTEQVLVTKVKSAE